MQSASSPSPRRRPCFLDVDDGGCVGQRAANATATSSVDRLLADIAFQRQRERRRAAGGERRTSRRCHREDEPEPCADGTVAVRTAEVPATVAEVDDEAASAYWWTDVFLRYFVFDDDYTRANTAADSDDLLFFVRRRRDKHKCNKRGSSSQQQQQQQRRRIVYDTRAYRKQQPQQKPTIMLPIGDPAILWPHTVCLNAIVHRFRYTLTVAVCVRVPRKSSAAAGIGYSYNNDLDELEFDDRQDQEYDLQLLSRHVHTVYASTSGRRMDAAKGPRERPVYPAVCWAADDYAEAFRTVIVRPGQTVCAELVAAWPGSTVVTEKCVDDPDDDCDGDCEQTGDGCGHHFRDRQTSVPVKLQQKQNRAVLFAGAVPYAAVRAAYECKMSLYRDAERQRKRRKQRKRGDGKKSSLGAALSASLTALFTGGKDSATGCSSDRGDCDYYYGTASANAADRVEYVTVRGCRPERYGGSGDDGELLSSDDENHGNIDMDDISTDGNAYDRTKGLAQMAVALAPIQREEKAMSCYDGAGEYQHHQLFYSGGEDNGGDAVYYYDNNSIHDDGAADYNTANGYNVGVDDNMTPVDYHQHHQQMESSSLFNAGTTASEPGDFYDYGWDYETAASSGQQTPQTPSYHYQLQQQQQLERQKRRGGRPRRLSDPCSTSVFDLFDGNCDDGDGPQYQHNHQQYTVNHYGRHVGGVHRKHYNQQQLQQKQLNSYGGTIAAVVTPGRVGIVQYPYRAWSESDGLNRCGGVDTGQKKQQQILPLPPPPVPYYCAAEAATSGFLQFVRKSPGNWWTRTKNHRRRRRSRNKRRKNGQKNNKSTTTVNRRRSTSAGDNGNKSDYCSINTIVNDKNNDSDNSDGSGSNSDGNESNSEDYDSDGEFIGALAAAAAFGQNPNHEWTYRKAPGDPVADWDVCKSDSNSDNDDGDVLEWTTEIMATDLRRKQLYRNSAMPQRTTMLYDDFSWYVRPPPPTQPFNVSFHQQHQQLTRTSRQNQRQRRQPPPQLQPEPLEPPPPPPALSVAFTAVACPWWTVLEDMLLVSSSTTSGRPSSSNKSAASLPLLTFD